MCNLGQGIREEGISQGEAKKEREMIMEMYKENLSFELIAQIAKKTVVQIREILEIK